MKYESTILCPDRKAGYQAFHELIQDGWEVVLHWKDEFGNNVAMKREPIPETYPPCQHEWETISGDAGWWVCKLCGDKST